ncbi:MAG: histidine kinase [Sphingobacteriaceae bacterium]|nr:histidine kinase [Sphingobacteriaceae bacterium]
MFISYELILVYHTFGEIESPYVYIAYYSVNIILFYSLVALLNFTFKQRRNRYPLGLLTFLGLFAGYLVIKTLIDYLVTSPPSTYKNAIGYIQNFFVRNIMRGVYFGILATFYWSAIHISFFRNQALEAEKQQLIVEKDKAALETQLTKSRNAYLQQQINPHMLFNALNFVYNSAQKYSDDAAQCIWLLSEIMRFSLEEAGPDGKIKLEREVEQIENLIAINRYRFKEPLYLEVEMDGDFSRHKIIPLILLTLTENLFKHGNLTEVTSPAILKLTTDQNGQLTFHSKNLKKSKNGHPRQRKAMGLENIRLRMDSFYKGNYTLQINEPSEFYELTLTLKL